MSWIVLCVARWGAPGRPIGTAQGRAVVRGQRGAVWVDAAIEALTSYPRDRRTETDGDVGRPYRATSPQTNPTSPGTVVAHDHATTPAPASDVRRQDPRPRSRPVGRWAARRG